jgi:ATP-binding cassette subfamily F protein 3
MSVLEITAVSYAIQGRMLLDRADLAIAAGQRVGLIGANGAGKSTLLRLIAGELAADGGEIRLAGRARLAWVRQEAPTGAGSVLETVLAADQERLTLLAESAGAAPARLAEIHERLRAIGAEAAPARAARILAGLGFDAAAQARPIADFSGGWRMRVALASALFLAPDLLLLDEPTNHLDLEAALWLESWLMRFSGAVLVVSHDRGLLDRAVHAIAHLDRGKLSLTPGGFEAFARITAERRAQEARAAARVAGERARIEAFVARFRAKATKARQAQSRLKALERLPQTVAVVEAAPARFDFPAPRPIAPPMLRLDAVSVGYDGRAVLRGISLRLDMEDRIALLGANGNGKSTLAKLLVGRLAPLAGEIERARGLSVGYFAQHQLEDLLVEESPLDHLARVLPRANVTALRAHLARFGLDAERVERRVGELSGGERARLALALATREAPHLLVLDEPTNHLDIDARQALVTALAEFPGAVVLISHDAHLIDLIADRLWLVANGRVQAFDGDLAAYRAGLATPEPAAASERRESNARLARRARADERVASAPLRRAAQAAEARLAALTAERQAIEGLLADPALYAATSAADIVRANKRLAAIADAIAEAEEAWLAAASALEEG